MLKIENAAGQIVAADIQASVAAIDHAVLSCSRLCGSIIEVSAASRLPISAAQQALADTAEAMAAAVKGREKIAMATRELTKVQSISTLRETSFGCPDGFPQKLTGSLTNDTVGANA